MAQQAEQFGVRVCLIRTGLVIADGGGLLQRMLLPCHRVTEKARAARPTGGIRSWAPAPKRRLSTDYL